MHHAAKSVPPEAPQAEARNATVVKCDVVGSTRILSKLDLDGQLLFKRLFESLVIEVATRNAGFVERFEGDGALLVFGYPQATEDAADAAVRAALQLVSAAEAVRELPDVQLQLRVGIASGRVAVIKQPLGAKSEPVAGLTIDLAERLRGLADPGRIVIADSTKHLAGGFFDYQDLGTVQIKGFDEGVRAWRVMRTSSVESRFEAQRFDESRAEIIGRGDAIATMSDAWSAAHAGNGQTVCLMGDAGIGKSRLARAALDRAAQDGATVLKIDCTPSTGNTPLFPIGVLLRRTANITASTAEEDRVTLARQLLDRFVEPSKVSAALAYLAPLFGISAVVQSNETPDQLRDHTISTVVGMVRSFAGQGPLALLCEDLHWADATTATVIERLADQTSDLPVLTIVTSRPDSEVGLDLKNPITIFLQPLDTPAATDLVRSIARGTVLAEGAIRGILARCEGVPLLLEEVTRSAVEASGRGESVTEGSTHDESVPAPLEMVVQSRLGRWPQLTPIVQAASVLGRDFSVRLLEQMVPSNQQADVVDAISLLARHGLFTHRAADAGDHARFKHAMICDAVYNTLLGRDRERLHSHAADTLSADYEETPEGSPEVIAEHLRKSRRFVESIRIRLAASADTVARGAYIETEGHCKAALALIDKVEDVAQRRMLQFKLLVQLGVALTGRHGYAASEVEDAYRNAQLVCGDSAEAEMLYPIIRGLATLNLVRGNLATANELSVQGLQLADRSNRTEFRIDALSVHCYTTLYYGRLEDCRSAIDRCLELYRAEHGESLTYPVPQDAATAALALLPTVSWLLGDSGACEQAIKEGLAHVESLNRDFDRALFHAWVAGTRYTQRRYAEASEHAAKAVAISQQHGYREWYGTGLLVGLLAQSALKASPEALAQATETCMAFAREGVGLNASYYLWGIARGHSQVGDLNTARLMLAEAFKRAEASAESRMNAELLILQAEFESDAVNAIRLLTNALRLADEQGAVATSLRAAAAIVVRSEADPADLEEARATLDFLDCRECYPAEPGWMRSRLKRLRNVLNKRFEAV
jgi:class 3 adenylate cyclase/tetratricopeptide (TPR) repeat protein